MTDELKNIVVQQYRNGRGLYELALAYNIEPKDIKKSLTIKDEFAHSKHPMQECVDIFDEIKYANYLLNAGKGKIVKNNGTKYVQQF